MCNRIRTTLKSTVKNRYTYLTILLIIITSLLIIITLLTVNFSYQLNQYSSNMKDLRNAFVTLNEDFRSRMEKLSGAELLLNNTNIILSTVYFGTADTEEREEAKDFTAFSMIYKNKFYTVLSLSIQYIISR